MMVVRTSSWVRQLIADTDALGVELPAGFLGAVTAARQLAADGAAYDSAAGELNRVALDLLAAGADPADDKEVARLAIRRVLSDTGLRHSAEQRAENDIGAAVSEAADDILAALAAAVADDADTVAAITSRFGDYPDLSAIDAARLSRDELDDWHAARVANGRIGTAVRAVTTLCQVLELPRPRWSGPLLLAALDLDALDTVLGAAARRQADAWLISWANYAVALPGSVAEFIDRCSTISAERARRAQAETAERNARGFGA